MYYKHGLQHAIPTKITQCHISVPVSRSHSTCTVTYPGSLTLPVCISAIQGHDKEPTLVASWHQRFLACLSASPVHRLHISTVRSSTEMVYSKSMYADMNCQPSDSASSRSTIATDDRLRAASSILSDCGRSYSAMMYLRRCRGAQSIGRGRCAPVDAAGCFIVNVARKSRGSSRC
jgi:hypothetical protein